MDKLTINLGWMYPDLLNLHGERGSVQAFVRVGEALGIEVAVRRIEDFSEKIPFAELDMLLFLPGELKTLGYLKTALQAQRQELEAYVQSNRYVLAIGTTGLLFGGETLRENGEVFEGLGLLDMSAKERKMVWGDDLYFRLHESKQAVLGSQIQMADITAKQPLGETLYGRGNDNSGAEGARNRNLIFTNCLGPVFVKNPWWTEAILREVSMQKALGLYAKPSVKLESESFDACLKFLGEKPEYHPAD